MFEYMTYDFIVPILIGIICFGFAARIIWGGPENLSEDPINKALDDEREIVDNEDDVHDFVHDHPFEKNEMETERKSIYVIFFLGLGVSSILFSLSTLYPLANYIAKACIALTLLGAVLSSRYHEKKPGNQGKI